MNPADKDTNSAINAVVIELIPELETLASWTLDVKSNDGSSTVNRSEYR